MEQRIYYIINTLNMVEIRGRDNMDLMLGAIMALEELAGQIRAIPPDKLPSEEEAEEHG